MKELIIAFNQIEVCTVDVEKVVKAWTNKFSISKYHEEYKLVKQLNVRKHEKINISKLQAQEIIDKLGLLPIKSTLLNFAMTYRSKSNIISERDRIRGILAQKEKEIKKLQEVLNEYNFALIG